LLADMARFNTRMAPRSQQPLLLPPAKEQSCTGLSRREELKAVGRDILGKVEPSAVYSRGHATKANTRTNQVSQNPQKSPELADMPLPSTLLGTKPVAKNATMPGIKNEFPTLLGSPRKQTPLGTMPVADGQKTQQSVQDQDAVKKTRRKMRSSPIDRVPMVQAAENEPAKVELRVCASVWEEHTGVLNLDPMLPAKKMPLLMQELDALAQMTLFKHDLPLKKRVPTFLLEEPRKILPGHFATISA